MSFEYMTPDAAKGLDETAMVVVRGVPSPWSESAKGVFHVKKLSWNAVGHNPNDKALADWTGAHNAPAVIRQGEPTRTDWRDILFLAEDLSPTPSLLPQDENDQRAMLDLAQDVLGENGLAWSRRLQIVHVGMQMDGAPLQHATYIGSKYGYDPDQTAQVEARVCEVLQWLDARLATQLAKGSGTFFDDRLTAIDIYSAAVMAMFAPMPDEYCPMHPGVRAGFNYMSPETKKAFSQRLIDHRDMIYDRYLALPLTI